MNSDMSRKFSYCPDSYCGKGKANLFANTGFPEDRAAVATLPDDWLPRHSGPILATYLKDREHKHKKILDDLANGATVANEKIDSKIRELAEQLLAHVQQNERDIDCVVESYDNNNGPLPPETRNEALKKINVLYCQRLEDVATFKRDALALEKERADELRNLMRDHFRKLVDAGHLTPKELLHDFDDRMYDINQQLLSNQRAYCELETQLHVQADESVVQARSALNQLCLGVTMAYRRRSAHPRTPEERKTIKRSVSMSEKRISLDVGLDMGNVEEIDTCVNLLVDAYRQAILKVISGFSVKLSDLHKTLTVCTDVTDERRVYHPTDLMDMIDRALRRVSHALLKQVPSKRDVLDKTHTDTVNLQKSLWSLGERLRDTYTILHDAGHLWDSHMLRSGLAQKLTMAAVEDLLVNNDIVQLSHEVNFNVAIEQLRIAPDVDKLKQQYEVLVTMLDRIAELNLQHSQTELNRLEEFINLNPIMARILLAEFNCFLEKHPRTISTTNSFNTETGYKSPALDYQRRSLLPRVILQTELQELALLNWKNGFLEAFENNMSLVPEELKAQARQWVDEKSSVLNMRYSLKLVSHSIRLERIKAARDARLAEIQHHEKRLESHLEAIYNLIYRLPEEASQFLSLDSKSLYPLCEWIGRIQVDMDALLANVNATAEVRKLKMSSYASRISKYRQQFELSLDQAIQDYKKVLEHRIQEGRVSNLRFITHIQLSDENGRFSASEALRASAALIKGAEGLEGCVTRVFDALNHRRAQLLALADQKLLPLHRIIEEYIKVSGKGKAVEKRRSTIAKRK